MLSALRAALRIARRDVLRSRGRSALVVAMIALPVMGATVIDVVARTAQLDAHDIVERDLGAAQARVERVSAGVIAQTPEGDDYGNGRRAARTPLAELLPAGSRILTDASDRAIVRTDDGLASTTVREFDYADPAARGLGAWVPNAAGRG